MKLNSKTAFIELLFYQVIYNLKAEARRTYLAYFWWLIEPILHMMIYYAVFGIFMNRGTENYPVFLICGIVPWLWFSHSMNNSVNSIYNQAGVIAQINISKLFFPLVIVFQDFVKQLIVVSVMLVFVVLSTGITEAWLALIPVLLIQLVFISLCAIIVASITPFIPDFKYIVITGLQLLMFASGIFYSYTVILPEHRFLYFLNPVAVLVESYRSILIGGQWPDWALLLRVMAVSVMALFFYIHAFKRFEHHYARLVLK